MRRTLSLTDDSGERQGRTVEPADPPVRRWPTSIRLPGAFGQRAGSRQHAVPSVG